jgi:hypothetical protein
MSSPGVAASKTSKSGRALAKKSITRLTSSISKTEKP